jgi:hypothetical protein
MSCFQAEQLMVAKEGVRPALKVSALGNSRIRTRLVRFTFEFVVQLPEVFRHPLFKHLRCDVIHSRGFLLPPRDPASSRIQRDLPIDRVNQAEPLASFHSVNQSCQHAVLIPLKRTCTSLTKQLHTRTGRALSGRRCCVGITYDGRFECHGYFARKLRSCEPGSQSPAAGGWLQAFGCCRPL